MIRIIQPVRIKRFHQQFGGAIRNIPQTDQNPCSAFGQKRPLQTNLKWVGQISFLHHHERAPVLRESVLIPDLFLRVSEGSPLVAAHQTRLVKRSYQFLSRYVIHIFLSVLRLKFADNACNDLKRSYLFETSFCFCFKIFSASSKIFFVNAFRAVGSPSTVNGEAVVVSLPLNNRAVNLT